MLAFNFYLICLLSVSLLLNLLFYNHVYASVERIERYSPPFTEPEKNAFPWIVQTEALGQKRCTGVLISDKHVLTSAHCLYLRTQYTDLTIVFPNKEIPFSIRAKRFIINPDYLYGGITNADLAIIEMDSSVNIVAPELNLNSNQCLSWYNERMLAAGYQKGNVLRLVELQWVFCQTDNFTYCIIKKKKKKETQALHCFFRTIWKHK